MNSLWRHSLAVAVAISCTATFARAQAVPAARVSGPIAVTADSFPLLAANRTLEVLDLANAGYVEEEFIASGAANVYDWAADGALSVKTPNAPYATRILVRRPANAARFSGTVIVELMHPARRFDWSMMWGYSGRYFLEHGDAWVGITMPGAIVGLKTFNPTRYAAVSFANPTPAVPCPGGGANATSDSEEGLRWDMISQVGALLKSNTPSRPLAALRVERVFMTTQPADIMTYINAIHRHANLATGKPVYDGYVVKGPAAPARINRCATAVARTDARVAIKNAGVPVLAFAAQGEVVDMSAFRRPDSDAAGDQFRYYEVAGASHVDKAAYVGFPLFEDQSKSGGNVQGTPAWPFTAPCDPPIPLTEVPIVSYFFNAAFSNLDQWVRQGTPAPRSPLMELKAAGTPEAAVALDQFSNGLGGVRSPYVDVPVATYVTNSAGPGTCRELGHRTAFDAARLNMLYGSQKAYVTKVEQSVDRLVGERWLTESDGKKVKAEAAAFRW